MLQHAEAEACLVIFSKTHHSLSHTHHQKKKKEKRSEEIKKKKKNQLFPLAISCVTQS